MATDSSYPPGVAAPPTRCTLLHISDLHFGTAGAERLAEEVLAAAEGIAPDAVVVSGDLVEWAERGSSWRAVAGFLRRFRPPVLAVPGNHDIDRANLVGRMWSPFRAFRRHVHDEIDRALALDGVQVVGLASPSRWTMDLGYVSRAQSEWAEDALAGGSEQALRVLVVHHGPRPLAPGRFRNHLRGRRLRHMIESGQVDLVLTGHRHFPHAAMIPRGGELGGELLWSQAGSATCSRLHRQAPGNSFTVVEVGLDRIELCWWRRDAEKGGFAEAERRTFPRARPAGLLPLGPPQVTPG